MRQAELAAVVASRWGVSDRDGGVLPGGASLRDGARGWVLVDDGERRRLGAALAWVGRLGTSELHVVVDAAPDPSTPGYLAWQAAAFGVPPRVWSLRGRELAPAAGAPPPPAPDPPAAVGAGAGDWPGASCR